MRAGLAQHDDTARPALGAARGEREYARPGAGRAGAQPLLLAALEQSSWRSPAQRGSAPGNFQHYRPEPPRRRILAGLEWVFLLFGLLAVDCYIWVNTAATVDQAYSDWAFDQTLRGLTPSVQGFVGDELGWLFRENRPSVSIPQENAEKAQPIPPTVQTLRPGELIGRLRIPRLNLAVMVREGASESTLRRAVGHIPGTGLPGQAGNVGLAGHRDTFFRPLQNIRKNDAIDVDTGHGTLRYLVTATEIVSPRDVGVLKASAGKTLTLVTCYPFYYVGSAPKRFIVRAVEVPSDVGAGEVASKRPVYKRLASNHRPRQRPGS